MAHDEAPKIVAGGTDIDVINAEESVYVTGRYLSLTVRKVLAELGSSKRMLKNGSL